MADTFANRLKEAMKIRKLTQTELCNKTSIPKSAMSQYLTGNFSPKQRRTYTLAKVLNVSEAWLMGYDVPMERQINGSQEELTSPLNDNEIMLVSLFRQINEIGQNKIIDFVYDIIHCKRYKKYDWSDKGMNYISEEDFMHRPGLNNKDYWIKEEDFETVIMIYDRAHDYARKMNIDIMSKNEFIDLFEYYKFGFVNYLLKPMNYIKFHEIYKLYEKSFVEDDE